MHNHHVTLPKGGDNTATSNGMTLLQSFVNIRQFIQSLLRERPLFFQEISIINKMLLIKYGN